MPAKFAMKLDRGARFVVLGTLSLVALLVVVGLCWPEREGRVISRYEVYGDVMNMVNDIEMFKHLNEARCPRDLGELARVGIVARVRKDLWNRPFVFECSEAGIRVCSRGRDEADPADDVCNDGAPRRY